jgi:hypothetical protein
MLNNLIGVWRTDPTDIVMRQAYGDVTIEFFNNGELVYTINESDREQKVLMSFEIKGNLLITDQPSLPQKEITEFELLGQTLELNFEGTKSRYIKIS